MLCLFTSSGKVRIKAMCIGTTTYSVERTWSILRFGSGLMTVLPVKSTLFPERLPLNRPCLPFSLWQSALMINWAWCSLSPASWGAVLGSSHWCIGQKLIASSTSIRWFYTKIYLFGSSPFLIPFEIKLLSWMISEILMVKSSSFVLPCETGTVGLMQTGGTMSCWIISSSGLNQWLQT